MRDLSEPDFMRRLPQRPSSLERWSSPGRKQPALQNHAGELGMRGIWFKAFNIPERLCFQMERWWSMSSTSARRASHQRHAQTRWPQRAFHPNSWKTARCLSSPLALGQNISLLFGIFFPAAGGAGRQTQTRPDKTFRERSSGRWGASASRSWLLVHSKGNERRAPLVLVRLRSCTFYTFLMMFIIPDVRRIQQLLGKRARRG